MRFKEDKKTEKKEKVYQKEGNKKYIAHEEAEVKEAKKHEGKKKEEPKKGKEKEPKKGVCKMCGK